MPASSLRWTAPRWAAALFLALASVLVTVAPGSAASSPVVEETPSSSAPKAAESGAKNVKTFGIGPANAKGLDRRQAFVYVGRPGTVIKDNVALLNYTFKPLKVRVYANDAFTSDTGAFDVLPAAEKPTDLGAWSNLKPKVVTIPARSKTPNAPPAQLVLPFRIKVPKNATVGDHAAGIVASEATNNVQGGNVTGIVVDRRVGTRVYLRVAGAVEPRLEIKDLTASYDGTLNPFGQGSVRVSYRVVNTGNVALSARQAVRVDGLLSTSAAAAALPDVVQVLPGDDVQFSTVVDGVWPTLRVNAVVTLDPYAGTPEAPEQFPSVSSSTATWAIPWTLIALAIALIGLGYWWARRSRRPAPEQLVDARVKEEVLTS
jgi:hypothetical protein